MYLSYIFVSYYRSVYEILDDIKTKNLYFLSLQKFYSPLENVLCTKLTFHDAAKLRRETAGPRARRYSPRNRARAWSQWYCLTIQKRATWIPIWAVVSISTVSVLFLLLASRDTYPEKSTAIQAKSSLLLHIRSDRKKISSSSDYFSKNNLHQIFIKNANRFCW